MRLPKDPFVNGQPIEAYLYKDASECPICFLYYPPYLNRTRCCDQVICSECFVQIKRPDPHIPEHQDPAVQDTGEPPDPDALTSEIARCPFCKQPDFGITYESPTFRRGLTYVAPASAKPLGKISSAMSSSSSIASAMSGGNASSVDTARRRAQSIAASDPAVITTDRVRPDWCEKLEGARSHAARRSAAATALHTAAYVMGNRGESDGRGFGALGRRAFLRRGSGPASSSVGDISAQTNILALMAERYSSQTPEASGQRGSTRRVRAAELEDMMLMEAIRMSLASEEDRRKEEEESRGSKKDAKKELKKREKEIKKAEKAARKGGIYSNSASQSSIDLRGESSEASGAAGKRKAVQGQEADLSRYNAPTPSPSANTSPFTPTTETASDDPQFRLERARAQLQPENPPFTSTFDPNSHGPSPLYKQSNISSTEDDDDDSIPTSQRYEPLGSSSSFGVSPSGSGIDIVDPGVTQLSGTPPSGGAGLEPMFNFRSLAAMVDRDNEKAESRRSEVVGGSADSDTQPGDQLSGECSSVIPAVANVDAPSNVACSTPSRSQSTRIRNEVFQDAMESTSTMALPEINLTAPSRTGSDLMSTPGPEPKTDIKFPDNETTETRVNPMVS